MSYDLMVFREDSAPKTRTEFMKWYLEQTEWKEEHSYDDPNITSPELRDFFIEMIKFFPALNGPFASFEENNENLSDYCIGKDVIYIAFAWSKSKQAFDTTLSLAERHGVGFFEVSGESEDIYFHENGKLNAISRRENINSKIEKIKLAFKNKMWWRFW